MHSSKILTQSQLDQEDALQTAAERFITKLRLNQLNTGLELCRRLPAAGIRYLQRVIRRDALQAFISAGQDRRYHDELSDLPAQAGGESTWQACSLNELRELSGIALEVLRQRLSESARDARLRPLRLDLLKQFEQELSGVEQHFCAAALGARYGLDPQQVYHQRRLLRRRLRAILKRFGL